jgi:hypothetical protein
VENKSVNKVDESINQIKNPIKPQVYSKSIDSTIHTNDEVRGVVTGQAVHIRRAGN